MTSSEDIDSSFDEIVSLTKFALTSDGESVSSPSNDSLGTSAAIRNPHNMMKLVSINSELEASHKDILIANLVGQIDELKQEKIELKQEVRRLQKRNETLNDQMHGMQERHTSEMRKFHERMHENMSARCEAKVRLH